MSAAIASPALSTEDKQQISSVLATFVEAWKQRDMAALGSTMTDDCDWVNTVGMHWHGREQVVLAHSRLLATRFKGVNIHSGASEVTEIAPGMALVIWVTSIDGFTTPGGQKIPPADNRGTVLMQKQQGKWLMRSSQNTPIDPIAAQHDPGQ